MALDSRQKRAAVIGVGRAWYRNPHPSSVDAAQRASIGQVYPVASFSAVSPPVFAGTIPNIEVDKGTGTYQYDYSSYFTGATSYSIAPAVETGWTFNTSTAVLTIDTDVADIFGSYVITGTNAGGSDDSNAFFVTVTETAFSGGYLDYYRPRFKARTKQEKKAAPIIERIAKKIAATPEIETSKDIELILHIQLEQEQIKYKVLYLTWLKREVKKEVARKKRRRRKKDEEMLILMMLH